VSRRQHKVKRIILPDPKYHNVVVTKFINRLMTDGKKSTARTIVYDALTLVQEKSKTNAVEIFDKALKNVAPLLEVKSKRIGGASYQVPREVHGDRRQTLAIRWIVESVQLKKGKATCERLAQELLDASKNEGSAVVKKNNIHKMAEANKAFAHFGRH
jgi:small subunit ribosomal protein S7